MSVRLTKKRLEIILSALAYFEMELIENEQWIFECASEADAQATIDGARSWAHEQLEKRKAKETR